MVHIFIKLHGRKTLPIFVNLDNDIWTSLQSEVNCANAYVVCNGKLVHHGDPLQEHAVYHVVPRLVGGKGGFGSMLRAIGAQIEKTTNREACRDLSGRRMRDVNNEKQLREWVSKASDREREKEERKKKRLEKLKTQPRHTFCDPHYAEQKSQMADDLQDALAEGLKRKSAAEGNGSESTKKRIKPLKETAWMGLDAANMSDLSSDGSEAGVDVASSDSSCPDVGASCDDPTTDPSRQPDGIAAEREDSPPSSSSSSSPQMTEGSVTSASDAPAATVNTPPSAAVPGDTTSESTAVLGDTAPESTAVLGDTAPESAAGHAPSGDTSAAAPAGDASAEVSTDKAPIQSMADQAASPCDQVDPSEASCAADLECHQVDPSEASCAADLESLGLERLKAELAGRRLKCGGTLQQRAERLFSVRGLTPDQIPAALLAKPTRPKKSAQR